MSKAKSKGPESGQLPGQGEPGEDQTGTEKTMPGEPGEGEQLPEPGEGEQQPGEDDQLPEQGEQLSPVSSTGKKYIVASPFRDMQDFAKGYWPGDDVSHFDQARLDRLLINELVELKEDDQ